MQDIKNWCLEKKELQDFEQHSSFAEAIQYLLNHYDKLVKFCEIEGALIDNNKMEETLKIIIRSRKNSYFYKTINGAGVANVLISVIATAYRAKVNIFEYLLTLQKNKNKIKQNAKDWMPWNYIQQVNKLATQAEAT